MRSTRTIVQLFEGLQRHQLRRHVTLVRSFPPEINVFQCQILELLGISPRAFAVTEPS